MAQTNRSTQQRFPIIEIALTAGLYYTSAQLGLALAIPPGVASAVWPPSGLALAALLLRGCQLWPGIWIGSFLANLPTLLQKGDPLSLLASLVIVSVIASGSSLQAVAGAALIRKINGGYFLDRMASVFKFTAIEVVTCLIACSLGTLALLAGKFISFSQVYPTWITWWIGDIVGILVITPLCLSLVEAKKQGFYPKRILEGVFFFSSLIFQSRLVFGNIFPYSYSLFPFIFWAAFRFRAIGVGTSVVIVSSAAIWTVLHGHSIFVPDVESDLARALFLTQAFLGVYTLTGMSMAAALEERRRATTELKKWEHVFSFAGWAVSIANPEGTHFQAVNPAYAKMHGYEVEEMMGLPIAEIFAPEERDQLKKHVQDALEKGDKVFESTHLHKDGSYIQGLTHLSVYKDSDGKVLYCAATFQEISDLKSAEDNLKKLAAELDRSNKELEQFAYIASHDLQEPLRVITMYLELLAKRYKGKFGKEADEFIEYARIGADDSIKMVRSLLEFARIGSQGKPFQPANFEDILKRALVNLELTILENGARVTHDPLPIVMADNMQMVRLIQNLISNAIKYHGEKPPQIHISAKKKYKDWVFEVRDNGIGIAPEYQERIFGIFQRLHSRSQGAGIGLAICKKIVERHGGKIWVESQPTLGATFYFSLPDRSLAAAADGAEPAAGDVKSRAVSAPPHL